MNYVEAPGQGNGGRGRVPAAVLWEGRLRRAALLFQDLDVPVELGLELMPIIGTDRVVAEGHFFTR